MASRVRQLGLEWVIHGGFAMGIAGPLTLAAAKSFVDATRSDPGVMFFELHVDRDHPDCTPG
jgi:hypothetical protein